MSARRPDTASIAIRDLAAATLRLAGWHQLAMSHLVHGERLLAFLDVTACHWRRVVSAHQLNLEDHQVLPAEGRFGGRQIELPHPAETLVIDRLGLVAVGEEAVAPVLQSIGVMEP